MPLARYSRTFIPTLKEAPADAQVASHRLLVRAGFIRQLGAGIYDHLPLARRSLAKVERIVRGRDGRHRRPGVPPAGHPPGGDLEGERPLGRDGRQHVPAEGPQGRRLLPGHDPRGDLHRHRPRRAAQLPAAAPGLVPDPDQVPRRASPQVGPSSRPPVHHEGRLLLRRGRGRARQELRRSAPGLRADLHPLWTRFRGRAGPLRRHGRLGLAGVHGSHRRRRGRRGRLPEVPLRSQHRDGPEPRTDPAGGCRGAARRAPQVPHARACAPSRGWSARRTAARPRDS